MAAHRGRLALLACLTMVAGCSGPASVDRSPTPTVAIPTDGTDPLLFGALLIQDRRGAGSGVVSYDVPPGSTKILIRLRCTSGSYRVVAHDGRTLFHGPCSVTIAAGGEAATSRVGSSVTITTNAETQWAAAVWSFS
jgi:hypothetical protein